MNLDEACKKADEFLEEASRQDAKRFLAHVIEGMDIVDAEEIMREQVCDLSD